MEQARINFFRKWHGAYLEDSGTYVSKEYKSFQIAFKRILNTIANDLNAELLWYHPNHYDESAMLKRGDKYCYIAHYNNTYSRSTPVLHRILVRTAEHEKDYRGGMNNFPYWAHFVNEIDELLGGNGMVEKEDFYPLKQRFPQTHLDEW